jgi:uncharacterized protein YoxC
MYIMGNCITQIASIEPKVIKIVNDIETLVQTIQALEQAVKTLPQAGQVGQAAEQLKEDVVKS